jgi:tRNA A-37 threonylcarbamoyl transferase component Bud32
MENTCEKFLKENPIFIRYFNIHYAKTEIKLEDPKDIPQEEKKYFYTEIKKMSISKQLDSLKLLTKNEYQNRWQYNSDRSRIYFYIKEVECKNLYNYIKVLFYDFTNDIYLPKDVVKTCSSIINEIEERPNKFIDFFNYYFSNKPLVEPSEFILENIKDKYKHLLIIYNDNKYFLLPKIEICGKGSFKSVFLAWDVINMIPVAMSILDMTDAKVEKNRLSNEIRIMKSDKLKNDNILNCIDAMSENVKKKIYIITKFYKETLQDIINSNKIWSYSEILKIIKDILNALNILEQNSIIHRDIKPENIFYDGTNYILGDFGLSTNFDEKEEKNILKSVVRTDMKLSKQLGTPIFSSLEQMRDDNYTTKSDIFSFGLTILNIIFKMHPFKKHPDLSNIRTIQDFMSIVIFQNIVRQRRNLYIQILNASDIEIDGTEQEKEKLKCLLSKMIDIEPANRKTASELLKILPALESDTRYLIKYN